MQTIVPISVQVSYVTLLAGLPHTQITFRLKHACVFEAAVAQCGWVAIPKWPLFIILYGQPIFAVPIFYFDAPYEFFPSSLLTGIAQG